MSIWDSRILGLILGLALSPGLYGQNGPDADSIHKEILALYNFHPHDLKEPQFTQKSAALDAFWDKAKANPDIYVAALSKELQDTSNPSFFMYDGSKLLLSLSDTPETRQIAAEAVARVDLKDLQRTDYLYTVHKIAGHNEDTVDAAFHILDAPDFEAFIPQHALTLGQNYCLIYMLFPEDPKYWQSRSITKLNEETDLTAQKSLLLLLWYAQTSEADAAIARFSSDGSKPQDSRQYGTELLERNKHPGFASSAIATFKSESDLRVQRMTTMQHISDEALDDFEMETLELAAKR